MKALTLLIAFAIGFVVQTGQANEHTSVYRALVEIQEMAPSISLEGHPWSVYQLVERSGRSRGHSERRFGWAGGATVETTGQSTLLPSTSSPIATETLITVKPYAGAELEEGELPYIDADGNRNKNIGVMLTATWCGWCRKMYDDTIKPLRAEGYKIYVIDMDEFPIKELIHKLDPTAEKMGRGAPYFVILDKGKPVRIFYGYTRPHQIRPHLKKFQEQLDAESDADDGDYNFR